MDDINARGTAKTVYEVIVAAIVWFALVLQFYVRMVVCSIFSATLLSFAICSSQ
jgi:uncharacterized membrane protein